MKCKSRVCSPFAEVLEHETSQARTIKTNSTFFYWNDSGVPSVEYIYGKLQKTKRGEALNLVGQHRYYRFECGEPNS